MFSKWLEKLPLTVSIEAENLFSVMEEGFGGRWVFPFCNILRAMLGTDALWTGGSWLGADNGASSESQQVEEKIRETIKLCHAAD